MAVQFTNDERRIAVVLLLLYIRWATHCIDENMGDNKIQMAYAEKKDGNR
jgi:hypothetical protein